MPQITLEYSANISGVDLQAVLLAIHQALAKITDINTCKSRIKKIESYRIGQGESQNAMVHLKIELLDKAERTAEMRKNLATEISAILAQYFAPRIRALGLNCLPTVHIAKLKVYQIADSTLFKPTMPDQKTTVSLFPSPSLARARL